MSLAKLPHEVVIFDKVLNQLLAFLLDKDRCFCWLFFFLSLLFLFCCFLSFSFFAISALVILIIGPFSSFFDLFRSFGLLCSFGLFSGFLEALSLFLDCLALFKHL